MNRKILLLTVLMAAAPGLATSASVYKWTDENGVTHFGDRQPTGQNAEQVNVRSGTSQGAGVQGEAPRNSWANCRSSRRQSNSNEKNLRLRKLAGNSAKPIAPRHAPILR